MLIEGTVVFKGLPSPNVKVLQPEPGCDIKVLRELYVKTEKHECFIAIFIYIKTQVDLFAGLQLCYRPL